MNHSEIENLLNLIIKYLVRSIVGLIIIQLIILAMILTKCYVF